MDNRAKQIFLKKRHKNNQQISLNVIDHQGNANQSHSEQRPGVIKKDKTGEGVGRKQLLQNKV